MGMDRDNDGILTLSNRAFPNHHSFDNRLQFVTDSAPGDEALLLLDFKDTLEPLRVFNLDFPSNLTVSANEHHTVHSSSVVC